MITKKAAPSGNGINNTSKTNIRNNNLYCKPLVINIPEKLADEAARRLNFIAPNFQLFYDWYILNFGEDRQ
jgi:hypothetical protein